MPTMGQIISEIAVARGGYTSLNNRLNFISQNRLTINFDYHDLINLNKIIGTVFSGKRAKKLELNIIEAFNSNVTISIGDDNNNQSLMDISLNDPSKIDIYSNDYSDIEYTNDTILKLYFTGTSITGSGSVVVYF